MSTFYRDNLQRTIGKKGSESKTWKDSLVVYSHYDKLKMASWSWCKCC